MTAPDATPGGENPEQPRPRAVLLAGGGTAGHVNPLLAVAEELRARDPELHLAVLGTAEGLESRLVPERGLEMHVVPKVPLPRRPTPDWFRLPRLLRAAVDAAGAAIDETGAQAVVGFGGYVSTPAYLAARSRGVPVVVHEQNARAGLANRLGARTAAAVAVTFPGTRLPRAQVTGLPLRPEIAGLLADRARDPEGTRRRAAAELGFDPARVTLLVTGGSLGAVSVNRAVAAQARAILATGAEVLHLTGAGKAEDVRAAVRGVPGAERYHVREYLGEMEQALAVADLVLCRSGAGTVSELAALGIPAVYVPLPVGNGEQRLNAQPVVAEGGGLLVADEDLTGEWIAAHLLPLLDPAAADERREMGAAAARVGVPDAAARVADLVLEALAEGERRAAEQAEAERLAAERAEAEAAAAAARAADGDAPEGADAGPADAEPDAAPAEEPAPHGSALDDLGRVHLLGVGGAGMSAVAGLLVARGLTVSGSDAHEGPALAGLREAGVTVHVGHDAAHVEDVDTVVRSSAVRDTNPEVARARERGIPVLHRSEALAALMAGRIGIAVAGAHGKTTTSTMVATALAAAGREDPVLDPSYAIGGTVLTAEGAGPGYRTGAGEVFVAEADESDGSFLAYAPAVAVVTNVEPDHLDHYGTTEAFEAAFEAFADRVLDGGALVACLDDPGAARLVAAVRDRLTRRGVRVLTYGTDAAIAADDAGPDLVLGPVRATGGRWHVTLTSRSAEVPGADLELAVPGEHNAANAAAAYLAAWAVGADAAAVAAGLGEFRGTGRRFEDRGTAGGVRVVDDYAHHPTEVAALLRTARQVAGDGRVHVLFQPHLYSRTRTFATQFGAALDLADTVVVTDVYAAREDPDPEVTGDTIVQRVPTPGRAAFVADRHDAARAVAAAAAPGDLVLTVGAGDVTLLAAEVLEALGAPEPGDGGSGTA
ncbi:UDP-N-acetylmuramate--L-alanine ligase [Cellulomonas hominis]|uniref:UDP-N-acetylmuramate--L-alanine ligase n=1 Tax=Cellulomonas hominis TaxID=156981 RepID=UPI0027E12BA9|nr:UDP-N-acetylmuramate--L-alanine ligase [Cellulomonas hominis]